LSVEISQGQSVGKKQGWRRQVAGDGQNDIAAAVQLQGEEIIGLQRRDAVRHTHRRMVRAQFTKQNIKRNKPGSLGGELLDQPAVHLPWPVKAEPISQRTVSHG
jgi:hypothetical protein